MSHFLGIDVSTTATKAVLMDGDGAIVSIGSSTYDYATPRPLWSEQDPELWWQAARDSIAQALTGGGVTGPDVVGIGLTGQMHGMVLLDSDKQVLRPAILWNDQRTAAECLEIEELVGPERLVAITGNPALTGFTAPKMLWTRNNEPDVWRAAAHLLLPKDYVRLRLSGVMAIDCADASGTLLLDLERRAWSEEVASALDIRLTMLPPVFEGPEVCATVSTRAAAETGLEADTPIVAGAGDQSANGVGVGAIDEGLAALSLGTSGVVFATTSTARREPRGRLHAFCHALPERWHLMGVMLSAAGSYRWLREAIAPSASFAELDQAAAAAPPGATGLVFLPYLTGERTPHADPRARGAFVGLTVRHQLSHLARAVLEGVAFGLRDSVGLMDGVIDITDIHIAGGGAASVLWRQIIADVLDRPVRPVASTETAAHGAAILAAVGAGAFASVEEACRAAVIIGEPAEPSADAAVYDELYEVYRDLYPALRPAAHRLSELDVGSAPDPSAGERHE